MFGPSTHARGVSDGNRSVTGAGRAFERLPSNSIPYWTTACDALIAGGESFALHLDAMTDEQLDERVALPNTSKSRMEMLLGVKEHEMHHRAQLMLVQRLLGIVPHLTRARQQR